MPIVHRGLRERGVETKKKAAQIVGNMSSLVTEPKDMIPYIGLLLPEVKKVSYLPMLIAPHLTSGQLLLAVRLLVQLNVVSLLVILYWTISCRF